MKNLLITGGSQGIGKATALEAAKKGMFIGINYNSNDKAAEETLSEVKELGGEGVILKCDVSKNSFRFLRFGRCNFGENLARALATNANDLQNYVLVDRKNESTFFPVWLD